jgi:hypothetical protein
MVQGYRGSPYPRCSLLLLLLLTPPLPGVLLALGLRSIRWTMLRSPAIFDTGPSHAAAHSSGTRT